jgi:S1-C subfamily serine protease
MLTRPRLLALSSFAPLALAVAPMVSAEPQTKSAMPSIASQSEAARELPLLTPQSAPSPEAMLEVPQPHKPGTKPELDELPVDRIFRQSQQEDARRSAAQKGVAHKPYIGIRVHYSTKCYLGMEENGLEVISVYPGSPGSVGGLKGKTPVNPLSVVGAAMIGPLGVVLNPLLTRSGAFGMDGDLIVAVDDVRVRTKDDLDAAMRKLKPGDTMYLTIIRPLPGGNHKTMKIAITVGPEMFDVASSAPKAAATPATEAESEAENYVY